MAQTYKNLEILVINDNSTDPVTIAALKEIEKSGDQRMKVLTKKNGGYKIHTRTLFATHSCSLHITLG